MPLPITGDMGWGLFAWLGAVLAGGAGVALAVWKKRTAGNNGRH